jgi:UDP-glucuronate 4-epimerase
MTKVLVTGCAGFIGSTLCERLLQDGYDVTGIDCFQPNYDQWIKIRNLRWLQQQPRFRLFTESIVSTDLSQLLVGQDYVFHLAAIPGVRTSWGNDFSIYVENNILATQKLLEAVKKQTKIKKLVYSSSSSVYGGMDGPTNEEKPPEPISPYGVTKLSAEQLCQLYAKNFGVPVISLRYFTVFGPRQRPDMAFHRLILRTLKGEILPVFGDGEQSRDFTYIADIVSANLLAMDSPNNGEVFNIGGISHLTVNEVITLIEQYTGKEANRQNLPIQAGDPKHTWADISKAKNLLGYNPKFAVDQGIALQVTDVKDLYQL